MGVRLATVMLISAIALAGAPAGAGSGVFKGASKAGLVINMTSSRGREDAAGFCRISKGEIERAARSILKKAGIAPTVVCIQRLPRWHLLAIPALILTWICWRLTKQS